MLKTIDLVVRGQELKGESIKMASDTINEVGCTFDFGKEWDFPVTKAYFTNSFRGVSKVAVFVDNSCVIPWEVLVDVGEVTVNVVGCVVEDDELVDRLTSFRTKIIDILQKVSLEATNELDPTPSEFDQFVAAVREYKEQAVQAAADAEAAAEEAGGHSAAAAESESSARSAATTARASSNTAVEAKRAAETAKSQAESAAEQAEAAAGSVESFVERAESAAASAEDSADTATAKAAIASTKAGEAASNASAAASSSAQAVQSATEAGQSAQLAESNAVAASEAKAASEGAATSAAQSATSAESARAAAAGSASAAETSATNAETYKQSAETAKTGAETASTEARGYATAAAASEEEVEDAKRDIQDSINGVAQEDTQDDIHVKTERILELLEYMVEHGTSGSLNGFELNLDEDSGGIIVSYEDPDTGTIYEGTLLPLDDTFEEINSKIVEIADSLEIIVREGNT